MIVFISRKLLKFLKYTSKTISEISEVCLFLSEEKLKSSKSNQDPVRVRLAGAQLWAALPVVGGECEVLGKRAVHSQQMKPGE